ncbi:MAG: MBOAT family protein [Planctomycetes bacterium]|nr:MBOAT family protein [Planctomycetota bacterium]
MLFCTYPFFVFLALVLVAIRLTERAPRVQKLVLLAASNWFYGYWDWRFLGLIWLTTVMDWGVALLVERQSVVSRRKLVLSVSIVVNLAILGFFKYFDFFQLSAERVLETWGIAYEPWLLKLVLPVGISFYVFQSMSYVVDVYRGDMKASRSFFDFALFVMYFPQLVAGPIERAPHLMPQLAGVRRVRSSNVLSGMLLILLGCVKKALVADVLGRTVVTAVYERGDITAAFAGPAGGAHLWLATIAFGLQIYGDFSGYCDVARGASRCLGVELVENFEAPYFASNITDFWRRWHISLSTWFRDYLYIPLGGNRAGRGRTLFNLALTMLLCGLWHGASWTFVAWGAWHGGLLLVHRVMVGSERRARAAFATASNKLVFLLKVAGTFVLVTYGWMLFRLKSDDLIVPWTRMLFELGPNATATPRDVAEYWTVAAALARTVLVGGAFLWVAHWLQHRAERHGEQIEDLGLRPATLGVVCGLLVVLVVVLGTLDERSPFIYFQF